ncbi:hypothetical protein L7F22_032376 [Adiantum nelumboides]|nr:hypothetical protein [Adiantum nelumboides]
MTSAASSTRGSSPTPRSRRRKSTWLCSTSRRSGLYSDEGEDAKKSDYVDRLAKCTSSVTPSRALPGKRGEAKGCLGASRDDQHVHERRPGRRRPNDQTKDGKDAVYLNVSSITWLSMGELSGNLRNVDRPNARAVRVAATPPLLDRSRPVSLSCSPAVGLELLQGLLQLNVLRQRSPREWRERMSGVEVDREDIGRRFVKLGLPRRRSAARGADDVPGAAVFIEDLKGNRGKVVERGHTRHNNGQVRGEMRFEERVDVRLLGKVEAAQTALFRGAQSGNDVVEQGQRSKETDPLLYSSQQGPNTSRRKERGSLTFARGSRRTLGGDVVKQRQAHL